MLLVICLLLIFGQRSEGGPVVRTLLKVCNYDVDGLHFTLLFGSEHRLACKYRKRVLGLGTKLQKRGDFKGRLCCLQLQACLKLARKQGS